MKIGCINVRTLGGTFSEGGNRDMKDELKKLPVFLYEFGRLSLQIIVMSETRTEEQKVCMHGYTCFFSDMPQGKGDGKIRRIHGVGIMVCDEWVGQVSRVVKVNERIMWIAGEFQGVYMAFIAAYAPTLDKGRGMSEGDISVTEKFYSLLEEVYDGIPAVYKEHAYIQCDTR